MGWEDRPYYRDRGGATGNPLSWLLTGSVPLFTVFGIRVRAHAMMLIFSLFILLFGFGGYGHSAADRVQSILVIFGVVLLHEFGHCFAARWTGGSADEIILTPLGGLAMTMARRKPWPTFVTVAGGPAVNVLICLVCAAALFAIHRVFPLGPWVLVGGADDAKPINPGWFEFSNYLFWIYSVSWALLVFNLLPVFPLDGGQILQSILWKPMGYYRSMMLTLNIGLIGSVLMGVAALATFGSLGGGLLLFIAVNCFMNCYQTRSAMRAEGPWAFSEEDSEVDYSASLYGAKTAVDKSARRGRRVSRFGRWAAARARKRARAEADEQVKIDAILAKVSAHGMHSLSWWEKRVLRKATERQRKRDLETSRGRGHH